MDAKPVRRITWEAEEGEKVVLFVPKFKNRYLVKWLVPRLAKPVFRVKLDQVGSFVWTRCDGETTVLRIAELMNERFGPEADPSHNRLAMFLRILARDRFINLNLDESDQQISYGRQ